LEELFQTEEWGEVEAGHDLDKTDIGSRIAASILMIKLNK
jgi:chaperone required for assembly of F1-ATPase